MSVKQLTGVRWSSCASCTRKGYYQGVGEDESPMTPEADRLLRIRTAQNDGIVAAYAADLIERGHDVVLEMAIPWGPEGCWTGHADLVDHTDRIVREFTGTKDCTLDARKVRQVAGYAKELGYDAAVVVFDPSTGEMREYPVNVAAMAWDIDGLMVEVVRSIATDTPPERVCKTPYDGSAMFCGFVRPCFEGWSWPQPAVCDDPDTIALAEELAALDEQVKKGADASKRQKELKSLLAGLVEHGVDVQCGSVKVRISDVAEGETLPIGDLRKAGFTLPPEVAAFVKPRAGSSRVSAKRTIS